MCEIYHDNDHMNTIFACNGDMYDNDFVSYRYKFPLEQNIVKYVNLILGYFEGIIAVNGFNKSPE